MYEQEKRIKETEGDTDMNSKRTITILMIVTLSIILFNLLKKDIWDVNAELLKEKVLSIEKSIITIDLLTVTPFEWDVVYSFGPYTPKDMIYETVGYKWDYISETVNEGMNQIVFLKDGNVVCYLYGYPENNGFGIYFTSKNKEGAASAAVLSIEDDLTFEVKRSNDVVYLKH